MKKFVALALAGAFAFALVVALTVAIAIAVAATTAAAIGAAVQQVLGPGNDLFTIGSDDIYGTGNSGQRNQNLDDGINNFHEFTLHLFSLLPV